MIQHESRELHPLGHREDTVLLIVRPCIEGDGDAVPAVLIQVVSRNTRERQLIGALLIAPVIQAFNAEESVLVSSATTSPAGTGAAALLRSSDGDVRNTSTIGKAHIALHLASLYAVAWHLVGKGFVNAFAVVI